MTAAVTLDYSELITRVDACTDIAGAGIIVSLSSGKDIEVRGGPRRVWVFFVQRPVELNAPVPAEESGFKAFWNRYGELITSWLTDDVTTNCVGAAAAGTVIYMSGGTTTPLIGAFAVNSAALCGLAVGKKLHQDEWAAFEAAGGTPYKTYFTIESLMSAADLLNGMAGVVKLMKEWQAAGKLAKLKALLEQKKPPNPKALAEILRELDPALDIGKKSGRRARLISTGHEVINRARFRSITNERLGHIVEAVGQVFTGVGGKKQMEKVWDMTITQVSSTD